MADAESPEIRVRVFRLPGNDDLPLPAYATAGSAGADLRAALDHGPLVLEPGNRAVVPTGIRIEIPAGLEGQVRPRSGRALREGLTLVNSPGTVDADYRGEIQVLMINLGRSAVTIERGERIAQLVLAPVRRATFLECDELTETDRGSGGFGHTGV